VPGFQQMSAHRRAHDAEPDETDPQGCVAHGVRSPSSA
jgi:hypothetical protein